MLGVPEVKVVTGHDCPPAVRPHEAGSSERSEGRPAGGGRCRRIASVSKVLRRAAACCEMSGSVCTIHATLAACIACRSPSQRHRRSSCADVTCAPLALGVSLVAMAAARSSVEPICTASPSSAAAAGGASASSPRRRASTASASASACSARASSSARARLAACAASSSSTAASASTAPWRRWDAAAQSGGGAEEREGERRGEKGREGEKGARWREERR